MGSHPDVLPVLKMAWMGKGGGKGKSGYGQGPYGPSSWSGPASDIPVVLDALWDMYCQAKGKGKGKSMGGNAYSNTPSKPGDESGGVLGEFTGTIKTFNEMKGFGFIECEDIKAKYEKDVWLHGCQMKGYRVGHTVKFTAYLTKKGDPQAKDLKSGLK